MRRKRHRKEHRVEAHSREEVLEAGVLELVGAYPRQDPSLVRRLVFASFDAMHPRAVGEELTASHAVLFAGDRLAALDRRLTPEHAAPLRVLFLSTRNDGISQIAEAALRAKGGDRVRASSAGLTPADKVLRSVRDAMAEVGLPIEAAYPKPLSDELVCDADLVVTMLCPAPELRAGQRVEDWAFDDPAGRPMDAVRSLRDGLFRRVTQLLEVELG